MDYYNSSMCAMCSRCQLRVNRRDVLTCPTCCCPLYCSAKCRSDDAAASSTSVHAHGNWCDLMRGFMQLERELCDLPFTFTETTTARSFDAQALGHFLMRHGVLGKGMWRRECLLWLPPSEDFFETPVPPPGEFPEDPKCFPWALPGESVALDSAPTCPPPGLDNWAEYYSWRGFRLDSPVAVLQQWPLTVHFVLTRLFASDHPDKFAAILKKAEVRILLVGAEKEAELASAFQELQYLCPQLRLHLVLVGKEISPKADGAVLVKGRVRFELRRGVFHGLPDLPRFDLAIGLNAGLAVFFSWPDTLRRLQELQVPSYFSDYCPYSLELSKRMVSSQEIGVLSEAVVNPFRSPLRVLSDQNNLPWFSNALLFRLLPR